MEDDFRFLRPGYVEKSIAILECEPLCLQVWAKRHSSPDGHGPAEGLRTSQGVSWRPVAKDFKAVWHGFSFNPNRRRRREDRVIVSDAEVAESERGSADVAEAELSELYAGFGYFAAMLWEDDGAAFTNHIGGERHVA